MENGQYDRPHEPGIGGSVRLDPGAYYDVGTNTSWVQHSDESRLSNALSTTLSE